MKPVVVVGVQARFSGVPTSLRLLNCSRRALFVDRQHVTWTRRVEFKATSLTAVHVITVNGDQSLQGKHSVCIDACS